MVAIPVIVLIGVVLIIIGLYFFISDIYWFLGFTVYGPADKLITFSDPNRVIKEYFCFSF